MIKRLWNWLDDRTAYRGLLAPIRRRVLPNGPKWGYTTASCLLWILVIVVATGFLMMGSYSPSTTSAWASVHYIEQSPSGSFMRGLHFYGAHVLLILFAIHTIRVLLVAAFRKPLELVWITGLFLLPLVVVWAITGNPLSGTQRGFSQIEVEGNIIASTPVVGPIVQRILIGGDEVGNLTLTHLYALHVAVMPLLVGALLMIHVGQVYRHGLAKPEEAKGAARPYWPYQSIRNMSVFGVVFAVVAWMAWRHGAPLDAPADPSLPHWTRPEWYFVFLFELRSYFVGQWEFIATVVLPGVVLLFLLAMPGIDRLFPRRMGGVIRFGFVILGLGAWLALTGVSMWRDLHDPDHQTLIATSEENAHRARHLADVAGIPPEGAIALLQKDPLTQGPQLFQQHCASCHSCANASGEGIVCETPSAPNLQGFGTQTWIEGVLDPDRIAHEDYFGGTAMAEGEMVGTIVDAFDGLEDGERDTLRDQMKQVAKLLAAEAGRAELDDEAREAATELLIGELACADCHRFHDDGELGTAPDLTGYASVEWLTGMIRDPNHERFYEVGNDRMPAFAETPGDDPGNLLTSEQIEMLARWLRNEVEPLATE